MFDVLGLDDLESRAYDRLLDLASCVPDDLSRDLGADPGDVRSALSSLESRGLVARSTTQPDHYSAAPPDVGLGSLIAGRQAELRRAQLALPQMTARYREMSGGRARTDVIDTIEGPQAVAQRFAQLQRGARREVLALVQPTVAVVTAEQNVEEEVGLARGVDYRVVVERTVLERPGFLETIAESQEHGEQVRVVDRVPLRMLISDRELALLPLADASDPNTVGALLVRPSGLLDAMVALFELVWQTGRRLHTSGAGMASGDEAPLDDLDAQVVSMLLAGLTDQAIGNQLGLSLRTVQRRAHQLMARTGVSTRLQLGYEVARRGWV